MASRRALPSCTPALPASLPAYLPLHFLNSCVALLPFHPPPLPILTSWPLSVVYSNVATKKESTLPASLSRVQVKAQEWLDECVSKSTSGLYEGEPRA